MKPSASRDQPKIDDGGLPARQAACAVLAKVLRRRLALDLALEECPPTTESRDRAFARQLVATVLRRLGQIDAMIDALLERPLPARRGAVRDILRLGAAQLVFLDTPAHAAVNTSVALAKATGLAPFAGLINALLRRLGEAGMTMADGQDAAVCNTPPWLWESWCVAYGEETARAIAAAHLVEAPLDISVAGDPAEWQEHLGAQLLPTATLRREAGGLVEVLPGYAEGAWWVQDAAAALPARLLAPLAGRRIVDLCAAPGGKTLQLAAAGALVTALDRSGKRLERLRKNLSRLHLSAEVIEADAARWRGAEPFDGVLLDAPCTATGTLRRHPDAAWLKRPEDLAKLAAGQDRLLEAAVSLLRPGGVLVYCVCSLQPEEGVERIEALLAGSVRLRRLPIAAGELGGLAELVTPAGDLRSLPCHLAALGGMDAFYAARLQKL